ncbi:HDIG domain-containing protein [Carboxydothermus islandicus]|uniref:HDIG domain-containing protein n=1 Tax=Carboxydothermus islandicus TaxID=661089 RepID=A0A1L8D076_9THEO|nr:transporter substrate-binding domain-containing protein [Carboxydothermus islandicus]GAV24562.1 HDIG domain-containing protein [Carboxydothermus islandicus]
MILKNYQKIILWCLFFLLLIPSPSYGYFATGDNNYPPHVYLNAQGQPEGFDIEVLKLIGEKEKVNFNIILQDWDEARNSVINGKYDVLIGVVKTPEREKYLDFSEPYMESKLVLFVPVENYYIHSLTDLKDRRLGVQKGGLAEEYLKTHYSYLNLYRFNSQTGALKALAQGTIDAVVGNYYTGMYYLDKEGLTNKIKIVGEPLLTFSYSFAVKKGNTALLSLLNKGIKQLKSSGELAKIHNKWFGENLVWGKFFFYFYRVLMAVLGLLFLSWLVAFYLRLKINKATKELSEINQKLGKTYENTIRAIVKALEKKESNTAIHTLRVNRIAQAIGKKLGLSEQELKILNWGTLLHDIGKLGIGDQILLKPGPLTSEEYEIIKKHPKYAYDILHDIDYLREAVQIALYHHEKYDGTGYPYGLKGDEIPLLARICSVADALEAMTADRPYRKGMTIDAAIEEIKKHCGTQFDPGWWKSF